MKLSQEQIKVLILDKHPGVLEGLALGLRKFPQINVVGTATNLNDVKNYRAHQPNLLVTDLYLNNNEERKKLAQMVASNGGCRALMINLSEQKSALANGAFVKLGNRCDLNDITAALVNGGICGGAGGLGGKSDQHDLWRELKVASHQEEARALSGIECKTLVHMCEGKNNDEIGRLLAYSSRSIRRYSTSIYEKLQVRGRIGAVVWAFKQKRVRSSLACDGGQRAGGYLEDRCEFSVRELDILKLMACEATDLEIAEQLSCSLRSVRRSNIALFHKMGVSGRLEAVINGLRQGLVKF